MVSGRQLMGNSFYSEAEIKELGLASFGKNVLISRKASFYKPEAISLGNNVRIDDFCLLSGGAGIHIGNYVHLSAYAAIYGGGGVVMENYSGLSSRATLLSETDDFSGNSMIHPFFPRDLKPGYISKEIALRKFSQVGMNSTVFPGVELGEGVAIGAHSLVNKSCDPWGIYAGIPATHLKERSRKLLQLEKEFRLRQSDS